MVSLELRSVVRRFWHWLMRHDTEAVAWWEPDSVYGPILTCGLYCNKCNRVYGLIQPELDELGASQQ